MPVSTSGNVEFVELFPVVVVPAVADVPAGDATGVDEFVAVPVALFVPVAGAVALFAVVAAVDGKDVSVELESPVSVVCVPLVVPVESVAESFVDVLFAGIEVSSPVLAVCVESVVVEPVAELVS